MGMWAKILDWICGIDLMTMDELKQHEATIISNLQGRFSRLNETIDTDGNGSVSVREAISLVREAIGCVRAVVKGMLR